jgi:predicted dehydrogenase
MGDVKRVAGHVSTTMPQLRVPGTDRFVPNDTDDACGMVLEFESGLQGLIHVSWVAHAAAGGIMRAEVHGDKGVLLLHRRRGSGEVQPWITVQGANVEDAELDFLPPNPEVVSGLDVSSEDALVLSLSKQPYYAAQRFVEAVLGNREPVPSLYEGAAAQAVIDSVVESHEKGVWVDVPNV